MLKFLTLAVKGQLNVHDLNNETVAGNVTDIRMMDYLIQNEKGEWEKTEAPAVSGRMLKHWHYKAMRHLILNNSQYHPIPLCGGCRVGEPIRPGIIQGEKVDQIKPRKLKDEEKFVQNCGICDIHGYLIAQEAKGKL